MLTIAYPEPDFQFKEEDSSKYIFDRIRKKWLLLTPEEWVRQNFIRYLIDVKKYPSTLIALEKSIRLGELRKRFDILVYDRDHKPWIMIECKSPAIDLDQSVLHQVLRYHIAIPAGMLVITNGDHSIGWEKKDRQLVLISDLPEWPDAK